MVELLAFGPGLGRIEAAPSQGAAIRLDKE
jgi:hypothetical protein